MVVRAQRPRVSWTPEEIDRFRREKMSVGALLGALHEHGRLLLAQPPGLGKTTLIDGLVDQHLVGGTTYDLIIYATSLRSVLQERPWRRRTGVAIIAGRPRKRCGPLDADWCALESAGCGALARATLCTGCPKRQGCRWPTQLSKERLSGARVVGTVQGFLSALPMFVAQVKASTGAKTVLLVIDEAFIVNAERGAKIARTDIERSARVFRKVAAWQSKGRGLQRWVDAHDLVLDVDRPLEDLPSLPRLTTEAVVLLQRTGIDMFGGSFRYIGAELQTLARSRRWREDDRVHYVRRPSFAGADYIVAAAHLPLELARDRLDDPGLEEFNSTGSLIHECTRVYNLASRHGMRCYFANNAPQIIFMHAQLIARFAGDGKRSIVVVRKVFSAMVATALQRTLRELTGQAFRAVVNPDAELLADPLVVPIVTYGIEGVNAYANFHAVFAVTGFYVRPDAVAQKVNDAHSPDEDVPVMLVSRGRGRELRARRHWDRRAGFDPLITAYQTQYEQNVVLQAAGRVRFVTQPRFVFLFQVNPPPYSLTASFSRLDDVRRYFDLHTRREWRAARVVDQVRALATAGRTAAEIVESTGFSRSVVYRALRPTSPLVDLSEVSRDGVQDGGGDHDP